MNTLPKALVPALVLAIGLSAPISLLAQPSGERSGRPERSVQGPRIDRLTAMSEHLGLTADQKTKVQAILESERAQLEALRADTNLTQEARREKMQAIRQSFASQIRAVLTPQQQAKMGEMRGPGGVGGPKGRPERDK